MSQVKFSVNEKKKCEDNGVRFEMSYIQSNEWVTSKENQFLHYVDVYNTGDRIFIDWLLNDQLGQIIVPIELRLN